MRNRTGLTRVDCVVAVACVVFVLANVPVIIAGGRGRAKLEVCMTNLRTLTAAWKAYADDNDGKVISGDVIYSWGFPLDSQGAWFEWPHQWHPCPLQTSGYLPGSPYQYPPYILLNSTTQVDWQHSIADGKLWNYVKDYDIYRCPTGGKYDGVTYSMSQSMNTYPHASGMQAPVLTNINKIIRPSERFVFLDNGYAKYGAFYVPYDDMSGAGRIGKWYDLPPVPHRQGTAFAFADGHAIYRKWTDPHALAAVDLGWGQGNVDECDCDLRWITKATWGQLYHGWACTDPNKNCPD